MQNGYAIFVFVNIHLKGRKYLHVLESVQMNFTYMPSGHFMPESIRKYISLQM